jgi:hypothetical protein
MSGTHARLVDTWERELEDIIAELGRLDSGAPAPEEFRKRDLERQRQLDAWRNTPIQRHIRDLRERARRDEQARIEERLNSQNRRKIDANSAGENASQTQSPYGSAQQSGEVCPVATLRTLGLSSATKPSRVGELEAANQNRRPWKQVDRIAKFHGAIEVAESRLGVAFTLNLSEKRIATIQAAAANGNDPIRVLSLELNRSLKKHLDYVPPYGFGFEFDPGGRLHIHGVVVVVDTDNRSKKRLHKALSAAGGKIRGRKGSTQAHSTKITYGTGWFIYTTKTLSRTRRMLGVDSVTFVNQELTRMTRAAWSASLSVRKAPRCTVNISPVQSVSGQLLHTREKFFGERAAADAVSCGLAFYQPTCAETRPVHSTASACAEMGEERQPNKCLFPPSGNAISDDQDTPGASSCTSSGGGERAVDRDDVPARA